MKMFNFIQSPISHNLRDPHSKALEPDRLSPPLAITTQPHRAGLAGHAPVKGVGLGILRSEDRHRSHLRVEHYLQGHFSLFTGD